jgi:hypothetical protein
LEVTDHGGFPLTDKKLDKGKTVIHVLWYRDTVKTELRQPADVQFVGL